MPWCVAIGCSNNIGKGRNVKMHRFPKEINRRKKWEANVNRPNWTSTKYSVLCQDHFDDSQYEQKREDNLRKLKPNAIPTLFTHSMPIVFDKPTPPPPRAEAKVVQVQAPPGKRMKMDHCYTKYRYFRQELRDNDKEEVNENVPQSMHENSITKTVDHTLDTTKNKEKLPNKEKCVSALTDNKEECSSEPAHNNNEDSSGIKECVSETNEDDEDNTFVKDENHSDSEPNYDNKTVKDFPAKPSALVINETYDFKTRLLYKECEVQNLKSKLKELQSKIGKLEKELAKEKKSKGQISSVYNPDQLLVLGKKSTRGCMWSDDTLKKALQLRLACGATGYQLLLSQGQPLPSVRTLRRRMESVSAYCRIMDDICRFIRLKNGTMDASDMVNSRNLSIQSVLRELDEELENPAVQIVFT